MLNLRVTGKLLDDRWPGDTKFNPSRFLVEGGSKQGSQIPWGIGPHQCIGQGVAVLELKIFFALMLRGYEYELKSNEKPSLGKVPDGMPVTFSRRC